MTPKAKLLAILPLLLLSVAAAAQPGPQCRAAGGLLAPPAPFEVPAPKRMTCGRFCATPSYVSDELGGTGSSCAAALSDLAAQVTSEANSACLSITGFHACSVLVQDPPACQNRGGGIYVQIGWGYYRCTDNSC
jgi:hypothetical protein